MDNGLCKIKYTVRALVDKSSFYHFTTYSSSNNGNGSLMVAEEEVECKKIRKSKRLARLKKIDQSVGCPNGSCHVRFWGQLSRDIVKPGSQLKLNVCAKTSNPRFGIKFLAANFTECVNCHIQVKGEERFTKKINNLVTCRLDSFASDNCADIQDELDNAVEYDVDEVIDKGGSDFEPSNSSGGGSWLNVHKGVRKTQSRLAVLLRNNSPTTTTTQQVQPSTAGITKSNTFNNIVEPGSSIEPVRSAPPLPSLSFADNLKSPQKPSMDPAPTPPSVPNTPNTPNTAGNNGVVRNNALSSRRTIPGALNSPPPTPLQLMIKNQRIARQIKASNVIQIPLGLSQFASEFISREYRLMLVAEVGPMEDTPFNANSIHTSNTTQSDMANIVLNDIAAANSSSSNITTKDLYGSPRTSSATHDDSNNSNNNENYRKSSSSSSSSSAVSLERKQQQQQQQRQQQKRWTVSEQASAIAGWRVDVVDQFDVLFDELIAPVKSSNSARTRDSRSSSSPVAAPKTLSEPEITVGDYKILSAGEANPHDDSGTVPADNSSEGVKNPSTSSTSSRPNHHRRTSSGIVGFLMRGFRSSSSSPTASPRLSSAALPQLNTGDGSERRVSMPTKSAPNDLTMDTASSNHPSK